MAVRATFLSALRACCAAPVPRPPQPMRPTLMRSEPAARTDLGMSRGAAIAAVAMAEVLRTSRRDGAELVLFCMIPRVKKYSLYSWRTWRQRRPQIFTAKKLTMLRLELVSYTTVNKGISKTQRGKSRANVKL